MWFRKIFASLLLASLAGGLAHAQTLSPIVYVPAGANPGLNTQLAWNGYVPQRVPDAYQTIIGVNGTVRFNEGLSNDSKNAGSNVSYTLDIATGVQFLNTGGAFNFKFINASGVLTTYTSAKVGSNGWVAFGNTPGNPDLSTSSGSQMILPYWSDLQANGVTEGGIYWRVDGTAPNRTLTIEWRVQGVSEPSRNPGNFQVKLRETINKIEMYYGPASIDRSRVFSSSNFGAIIGLKNQGMTSSVGNANNSEKYLIMTDPSVVGSDTLAITRLRLYNNSTPETTPYFSGVLGVMSRYWFYKFPTAGNQRIGFAFSPVTDDVAADTIRYTGATPGNAYMQNAAFQIEARFVNVGSNPRQNIPVTMQIFRGNTLIDTRTGTAFPTSTPQGGRYEVNFGFVNSAVTSVQGTYTIKVFPTLVGDQDPNNDILTSTFYVSFDHDFMPVSINDPKTYTPLNRIVYPIGSQILNEGRFLNIGTATETDVPVGMVIYNAAGTPVFRDSTIIRGSIPTLTYRDVVFPGQFIPTEPGNYYIKIFSMLPEDRQLTNDTLPKYPSLGTEFTVRYVVELEANTNMSGTSPIVNGNYPVGRPINIFTSYENNGIIDAANVPGRVVITDPNGNVVYDRTAPNGVTFVPGATSGLAPSILYERYPSFTPQIAGRYTITSTITEARDPLTTNNSVTYTFNVKPPMSGTYYVGVGERFQTIQEANDSLFRYGVNGPVNFKLVNDFYEIRPLSADTSLPALDGRGDVFGANANRAITWTPAEGKNNIRITIKSRSGIGIMYGQRDTLNPTGYITWDGGANKAFRFVLDTMQATPAPNVNPARRAVFYLGQGASNFGVKNSYIYPASPALGLKSAIAPLPVVLFNRSFNTFDFTRDDKVTISAGIIIRNSAPADINGANPVINGRRRDTLYNAGNVIDGNDIRNFGYGIVSIGAGPLYRVLSNTFTPYLNQNNRYINNTIDSVTRAGIVVAYEDGSEISNNTITHVSNIAPGAAAHAVGIWASPGGFYGAVAGDSVRNRAYSTNLRIERNRIGYVKAGRGNGAAIWIETPENLITNGANTVRLPLNGQTNNRVWNNFGWSYAGATGTLTAGIALTTGPDTRIDFVTSGNQVDNNTLYNNQNVSGFEYGVVMQRNRGTVRNNIIALLAPAVNNPVGLGIEIPNDNRGVLFGPGGYPLPDTAMKVDYNLYWVPNGIIGGLTYLSTTGYNVPTPPIGKTLNQWRAISGLDMNSLTGDITAEFVSITPGAEDLHIRTGIVGSLVNNRGINIPGMAVDIDGDPRGSGLNAANYDIGADEFNGLIRNNDLIAEDVIAPYGYRATTGQYSDAEYVMGDSLVSIRGRFRNIAGLPQASNTVTMTIERYNGTSWVPVNGAGVDRTTSFNVAQGRDIDFGTFMPQTLRELAQNDPFYGLNPNVSPLYRIRIASRADDFNGNNTYEKVMRFYVPRSTRSIMVAVENYLPGLSPSGIAALSATAKANKLNADSLISGLTQNFIYRADGDSLEDYDLFERDKWPLQNLNFKAWRSMMWAQGPETQGLEPEERFALKEMLNSRNQYNRASLIIGGQDIIRIHDVALTSTNGRVADQDFVRNYLRAENRGGTNPANYSNRQIRGVAITPGKYEVVQPTAVAGDNAPFPALMRVTNGDGISRPTHYYYQQVFNSYVDSTAGVATAATNRNVVFYGIDWRHYGRFPFESFRSGVQRLVLGALDFVNQHGGILPTELKWFEAKTVGNKVVRIDWETASEVKVASLEVERAEITTTEQGEREGAYSLVARKTPMGSATQGARYDLIDQNVKAGATYRYRLVNVDLDGSRKVVGVDQVKLVEGTEAAGFSLTIQPNPAHTTATVNVTVPEDVQSWHVQLFDAAGRLVKTLDGVKSNASSIELNVADLASGSYTVRLNAGVVNLVEKLTIQK